MNTHTNAFVRHTFLIFILACVAMPFGFVLRAQSIPVEESEAQAGNEDDVGASRSSAGSSEGSFVSEGEGGDASSAEYLWDDASSSSASSSFAADASEVSLSSSEPDVTSSSSSAVDASSSSSESDAGFSASSSSSSVVDVPGESTAASESDRLTSITANFVTDAATGEPSNVAPAFVISRNAMIAGGDDVRSRIEVSMTDTDGRAQDVDVRVREIPGGYRVSVIPPAVIRSGTHRLRAVLHPARGSVLRGGDAEDIVLIDRDVFWGNVAMNVDRSHYAPGDVASVTIAPLLDKRVPSCVDELLVSIDGDESAVSPSCDGTIHADIAVPERDGAFALRAEFEGQSWSVSDAFSIDAFADVFDVRRIGPTSVVLGREAEMQIVVSARRGFRGTVTETVPSGFVVKDADAYASVDDRGEDGTVIEWKGEWQPGVPRTLRYVYVAPAEASLLGLFGPLKARGVAVEDGPAEEAGSSSTTSVDVSSSSSEQSSSSIASDASASDSQDAESSASSSASYASSESTHDAAANAESTELIDVPIEVQSSPAEESFLGAMLLRVHASLFAEGDTVTFDEDRAMQVLVVAGSDMVELSSSVLELTPLKNHFEARESATFRLLSDVSPTASSDGSLTDTEALATLVDALSDADDVRRAVLAAVVQESRSDIAQTLSLDSESVSKIRHAMGADGSMVRRLSTVVSTSVERAIASDDDLSEAIAETVRDNAEVQTVLDAIVTDDVREEIAREVVSGNDVADVVTTIVSDRAPELSDVVVRAVGDTAETADVVADAIGSDVPTSSIADEPIVDVVLTDASGRIFTPAFHFKKGSLLLVLDPLPAFTPGLYTLTVTVTNPLSGEVSTVEQDFAWGVLAINPDADVYEPGQKASLHIGVLNDAGEIVCDADLSLSITAPDGTVELRTTDDGSIVMSDTCGVKETGFIEPDYHADTTLLQEGDYVLRLVASTMAGERSMTTVIPVRGTVPFRITRSAATRLWPIGLSGMDIRVVFSADVNGSVIDSVPSDFSIASVDPPAEIIKKGDGTTSIRWSGEWRAGQSATFHYEYDAPDVSPQYYLIGPLQIRSEVPLPFFR